MNNMSIDIYQNIVVVSVFDVEKVLNQTVASQGLDEVSNGCFPVRPEDLTVDIAKTSFIGYLFEVTDGLGVIDELDETTVRTVGDDGVGSDPDFYVFLGENLIEEGN
jgi:hypothetical protein